jgi:hypothetical protein
LKVLGFKKSKVNKKTHIEICKDLKNFSLINTYIKVIRKVPKSQGEELTKEKNTRRISEMH